MTKARQRLLASFSALPVIVGLVLLARGTCSHSDPQPAAVPPPTPASPPLVGIAQGPGAEAIRAALGAVRVPAAVLPRAEATGGSGVLIVPGGAAATPADLAAMAAFHQRGGALIVLAPASDAALESVGARALGKARAATGTVRVTPDQTELIGIGEHVRVAPGSLQPICPGNGARTLGAWCDAKGATGPLVVVGERRAFVALSPGKSNGTQFGALLRAVIGLLEPGVWERSLPSSASEVGPIGPYETLADLIATLAREVSPERDRALARCLAVTDKLTCIRDLLAERRVREAVAVSEQVEREASEAYWASYPSVAGEMRGCWATASPEPNWDTAMANLAAARFNTVFPYIVSPAAAFYASDVAPRHSVCKARDPLAEAVAAAHAHGLKVHPRMLNLECLFPVEGAVKAYQDRGLTMVSASGAKSDWLCPSRPENVRQQVAMATEIVTKYDVDGLQVDYLRFPGTDYCFCGTCRQAFETREGVKIAKWPADVRGDGPLAARYREFRRDQISAVVRELSAAVRAARPGIPFSAAVFVRWDVHREEIGQDWVRWLKEGWVDFVCPMNYTSNVDRYQEWVQMQRGWIGEGHAWVAGVGPFADNVTMTPQQAVDEIQLARAYGSRGFVLFNYRPELAERFLPVLSLGVTAEATEFRPNGSG